MMDTWTMLAGKPLTTDYIDPCVPHLDEKKKANKSKWYTANTQQTSQNFQSCVKHLSCTIRQYLVLHKKAPLSKGNKHPCHLQQQQQIQQKQHKNTQTVWTLQCWYNWDTNIPETNRGSSWDALNKHTLHASSCCLPISTHTNSTQHIHASIHTHCSSTDSR